MTLMNCLAGYRILTVCADQAADLLELCRVYGYVYSDMSVCPDGQVSFCFRLPTARRVTGACRGRGIEVCVGEVRGLPALCRLALGRPGLIVGVALSLVLLVLSCRVVWDIRVEGNDTLSSRDVEDALAACGFGIGTTLDGFRADKLENRVLMYDGRIAWISVNIKGTVAYVQIRETQSAPSAEADTPANVVAARPGKIERVELEEGNVLVAAGDLVDEGDLLVSGLYDSDRVGFRFTRASAKVYARTVREFTVTIPLEYEQKVYLDGSDGRESKITCENSLIFFGKNIKFSKKTGNMGAFCDTIERTGSLGILDGIGFPIEWRTVWYLPYETAVFTRTAAEAEELAYHELAQQIGSIPGGAELISKRITTTLTDNAYILNCTIVCVEDIARVQEFEVEITE